MEFFEVIKKRHCCRNFDPKRGVSEEDLNKIIEAGRLAPSAGNMQDWRFNILRHKKEKEKCAEICVSQSFIAEAPIVIIISSDLEVARNKGERGVNLYSIQDTAAAAENMFLAATALGLGACWIGAFAEDEIKKMFNLPETYRPLVIMPIGYWRGNL